MIDIPTARQVHIEITDSVVNSVNLRSSGFADCVEAVDSARIFNIQT